MTFDEYKNIIKVKMGKKRYTHSINVAKAAQQLAIRYGGDIEKAMIAGILHDITKEMPFDQQLQIIESNGIILNNVQSFSPKTWHAISGSVVIEKEIGIADEDILNAVKYHTSGRANMSLLEKIIFVADFIGEERDYKGVDVMRSKAKKSLEEAMLYGVTFTIRDLAERQCAIDMNTLALYNELIINKNRKWYFMTSLETAKLAAKALSTKKGLDIKLIKIDDISVLSDYMVIATGTSSTQVKAMADHVEYELAEAGVSVSHIEGYRSNTWILMDYIDVIVHVFMEETREFYDLERLWQDGESIDISDIID